MRRTRRSAPSPSWRSSADCASPSEDALIEQRDLRGNVGTVLKVALTQRKGASDAIGDVRGYSLLFTPARIDRQWHERWSNSTCVRSSQALPGSSRGYAATYVELGSLPRHDSHLGG
jgi:hypothetical protein